MKTVALLAAALALCGCVRTDPNGVRTHVIIGFGVVKTGSTNAAGSATTVKAVGLYGGSRVLSLGYLSQTRVEIQTNANITLELRK